MTFYTRYCSKCKQQKAAKAFCRNASRCDGFNCWCRECSQASATRWANKNKLRIRENARRCYAKNKERYKRWSKEYAQSPNGRVQTTDCKLRKTYGITIFDFVRLKKQQQSKCLICEKKGKLGVDHCHSTNKIRGLLCVTCNIGLGCFKDSPELLLKAAIYILRSRKKGLAI